MTVQSIPDLFASLPRQELSARTGFSGNRLNRHGDRRNDAEFMASLERRARFILFEGAALIEGDLEPNGLYHSRLTEQMDPETRVFCGEDE
ncbi:MAG: hypothetical protein AAGH60_14250, partial [Pseudomonadota bacterium]